MAEKLVSTEPATGAELWSGEVGDAAAEVAAGDAKRSKGADAIAAAKAKAAEIAARFAANKAPAAPSGGGASQDRMAAMKARIAAMQAGAKPAAPAPAPTQ